MTNIAKRFALASLAVGLFVGAESNASAGSPAPQGADLTVKCRPSGGDVGLGTCRVWNIGHQPAAASVTSWSCKSKPAGAPDSAYVPCVSGNVTANVPALSRNGHYLLNGRVAGGPEHYTCPSGRTCQVVVTADSANQVAEANETNNTFTFAAHR